MELILDCLKVTAVLQVKAREISRVHKSVDTDMSLHAKR